MASGHILMMKRKICTFLIVTLHIVSWSFVAAHPFSPLDHSAPLQQEGTRQGMQPSEVTFHSKQFQGNARKGVVKMETEEEKAHKLGISRLGSRPPNCDHRCGKCKPCIAIQVPTKTQQLQVQFANYEPEGWKCKCGSSFFTP